MNKLKQFSYSRYFIFSNLITYKQQVLQSCNEESYVQLTKGHLQIQMIIYDNILYVLKHLNRMGYLHVKTHQNNINKAFVMSTCMSVCTCKPSNLYSQKLYINKEHISLREQTMLCNIKNRKKHTHTKQILSEIHCV